VIGLHAGRHDAAGAAKHTPAHHLSLASRTLEEFSAKLGPRRSKVT